MELFNDNKTFGLVLVAMIGAIVLIITGHIPDTVTIGEYTALMSFLTGIYAVKSGVGKFAKAKRKEGDG